MSIRTQKIMTAARRELRAIKEPRTFTPGEMAINDFLARAEKFVAAFLDRPFGLGRREEAAE